MTHEVGHLSTKNNCYTETGLNITVNDELLFLDFRTLSAYYDDLYEINPALADDIRSYLNSFDVNKSTVSDYGSWSILEAISELSVMKSRGEVLTSRQVEFLNLHID